MQKTTFVFKILLFLSFIGLTAFTTSVRRIKGLSPVVTEPRIRFKYIYGPVSSWRLGRSLGIDPVSQFKKTCSFDCFYCQVGGTEVLTVGRKIFVPTEVILTELKQALSQIQKPDYITFAGRGEPTLAKNLGEIIQGIKKITDVPVAILTNATALGNPQVQEDLKEADFVIAKIDAYDENSFQIMNRPHPALNFERVIKGIREFRKVYPGRMGIQIMFTKENKEGARKIAEIVKELGLKPNDQIQLNTPLRPRVETYLTEEEMNEIKEIFQDVLKGLDLEIIMAYEKRLVDKVKPLDSKGVIQRRGEENYN